MTSIKNFFALTFGILGAVILAPFVAFFGLLMLGLTFGLALLAAGAVTAAVRDAEMAAEDVTVDAEAGQAQPGAAAAA